MTPAELFADPDWKAFLSAIRLCPHDDLARLAAADWLDEHGDNQFGMQIRQMIEYGLESRHHCPAIEMPCEGIDPLPGFDSPQGAYVLRRGMIDEVISSADEWLAYGPIIVRHPLACLTRVLITDLSPDTTRLKPGLLGWRRGTMPDPWFDRLAGWECIYPSDREPIVVKWYTSSTSLPALSAACLAWAWESSPIA